MGKHHKNIIVGLDIGTSKVVVLIGCLNENKEIEIKGLGSHPSLGMKKGQVVNIESTVHAIQQAVALAETMAGYQVNSVVTGIAGGKSINSYGTVPILQSEVNENDVKRVIESAKAFPIGADQRLVHVFPQEFIIDNQYGIRDPIGMSGVRLEAKVHMVVGSNNAAQNIATCVQRCGLEMNSIVLEQVASSQSVLQDDERESGVCLVDIGAGTADIAVFVRHALMYTKAISIAGDQVTNDIALTLQVPLKAAEELKVHYASARSKIINSSDAIIIPATADRVERKLSRKYLVSIVEARYVELFTMIRKELEASGLERMLACGVVLTGGASKIPNLVELAESILHMPVRLGNPTVEISKNEQIQDLADPIYATSIGLLLYAKKQQFERDTEKQGLRNGVKGMWQRMSDWFKGNF